MENWSGRVWRAWSGGGIENVRSIYIVTAQNTTGMLESMFEPKSPSRSGAVIAVALVYTLLCGLLLPACVLEQSDSGYPIQKSEPLLNDPTASDPAPPGSATDEREPELTWSFGSNGPGSPPSVAPSIGTAVGLGPGQLQSSSVKCEAEIEPIPLGGTTQDGEGPVRWGDSRIQRYRIRNVGSGPCVLPGAHVANRIRFRDCQSTEPHGVRCDPHNGAPSSHYNLFDAPGQTLLKRNDVADIDVLFTAPWPAEGLGETGVFGGQLIVKLIDPSHFDRSTGQPNVVYADDIVSPAKAFSPNMITTASAPAITTVPLRLEFGRVPLDCEQAHTRSLEVVNPGLVPLTIHSVDVNHQCPQVTLESIPALPLTLLPGQKAPIEAGFRTHQITDTECTLRIASNAQGAADYFVPLRGSGTLDSSGTDTFEVDNVAMDVLVILDDSPSMSLYTDKTLAALAALFDALEGTDYRVMLTTTDANGLMGQHLTPPISAQTSDPLAVASFALSQVTGQGTNAEQGLFSAFLAAAHPGQSSPGISASPLRPHASLEVIFMTDEDDASIAQKHLEYPFVQLVGTYETAFMRFHAHGIMGLGSACTPMPSQKGLAYVWWIIATGGQWLDLCAAEPGPVFQNMALAAAQNAQHEFRLSSLPASIQDWKMTIDDVSCNAGWAYDPLMNAATVMTDKCQPQTGQTLQITYPIACPVN